MTALDYSPTHFRVWNSTRLGWLKSCPYKLYLAGIQGWRPKHEGWALRFGREYQYGLELYDRLERQGLDHNAALEETVHTILCRTWEDGKPWGPGPEDREPNRNRETLIRSLVWYLDTYVEDPVRTITLASGIPAVELTFQFDAGFGPKDRDNYIFSGHLDRVASFGDDIFVVDHKHTTKTLGPQYFSQYDLDNQMSLYAVAGRIEFQIPIKGVLIDAAQVAVGFTRFERGYTFRSDSRMDEWLDDAQYWIGQAEVFSNKNHWPQNDRSCFLCEFKRVCVKNSSVREITLNSDFERKPHDPLEIR